jgi:hypothetical protein
LSERNALYLLCIKYFHHFSAWEIMLKFFIQFFSLFIVLLLAGCRNDVESPGCGGAGPIEYPNGVIPSPDLQQNVDPYLFQTGSSWIYYDSLTTLMDTLTVASISHEEGEFSTCIAHPDVHTIELHSENNTYYLRCIMDQVQFTHDASSQTYFNETIINQPTDQNGFLMLDSLILPNEIIYQVMRTGPFTVVTSENTQFTEYYYFADNIGLLRKDRFLNDVLVSQYWLEDYNVVF